jgi:hypothetical protein
MDSVSRSGMVSKAVRHVIGSLHLLTGYDIDQEVTYSALSEILCSCGDVEVREHLSKYAYSSDLLGARTVGITVGVVCLALYILANFTSRLAWIIGTVILGMVNARMIVVFHDANHGRPGL